ncbi:hypothetical protein POV27_02490 [Aureisphaera galaxeae]|uniref:tetratricopeptide repeat protein n=1 Tax=Aureisphaera galaxeae TaxID=1538023 RepID=UPI00234FCF50|nr:hypothetical protein [Aureisphaera galaxeae]MDC8002910.1 hypothetical protein [Aureisphaera galaxeae]
MKNLVILLFASLIFLSCNNSIDTADELIEAHLEALGGYEAYKAIHTLTFFMTYEEGNYKSLHRFDRKRPNFIRITTNYDEEKGTFGYCEGFDGAAWEYSSKIPVRVVGEPARALKNASTFEKAYIDYKVKGYSATFKGITTIKGYEVYHLELRKPDGWVGNYFFDVETLMESISIGNAPYHGEGKTIEIFERRYDYRPVAGIMMSFKSQDRSGDKILSENEIHRIEANLDVPQDWFSPPLSQEQEMFKNLRETILDTDIEKLNSLYGDYKDFSEGQFQKKLAAEVNTFGYELISYERFEDAIEVFKMGTVQFPSDSNLFDSLGETYLAIGDTVNARINYAKSVALNPNNKHGIKVLNSINKK